MKGITKIFVGAVAIATTATAISAPIKAADAKPYKLVWSDEFDGTSLDTDNWNYNTGDWGWGNNEWENYTEEERNIQVKNGTLIITPRADKNEKGGIDYTSGRINSSGKASFKYGKIEARIKLPSEKGLWPAFWMLGQNQPKGWPYCGEIDILETWNKGTFAQAALHFENEIDRPGKDTCLVGSKQNVDKTQWHIYGMNWTPKKIEFYLDNVVYKTFEIKESYKSELRNDDYYFILNCAIGGNLPGVGPDDDFTAAQMLVDYVRVYQRENEGATAKYKNNDKDLVAKHQVTFKSIGKTVSSQTVQSGETLVIPTAKRAKYKFLGWFNTKTNKKVKATSRIYSDTTVQAKWEKIKLKRAKITSTKQKYKKALTVRFKAAGKYDGFQVKAGKKKDETPSKIITMLNFKSGKTYKVKVRTYAIDSLGKKRYGKWSKTVKIKVK